LKRAADPAHALALRRFFKTGPGQYGEGDRFLGIRVPSLRALAREYEGLPLSEARALLASDWHEARLLALLILVRQHHRGTPLERQRIFRLYLRSTGRINNWDLVDCSAPQIAGPHLLGEQRARLTKLAQSPKLWERRIAMLATFHGIKRGDYGPALEIAERLLADQHDLIHKAVGWMLREVGNRDRATAEAFLRGHAARMPRTALRYAIERFPEAERRRYLSMRPAERASYNERGVRHTRPAARRRSVR
jgi:3-methyladenine DNA glycosylase AlkD